MNRIARTIGAAGVRSQIVLVLIEVPAVAVMLLMMVHIVANAVLRTLANAPIAYTLEIVQYIYLPVVALLGFVSAQHRGAHIAADVIFQLIPSSTKRPVFATIMVVSAVVSVGFAWFGLIEAMHRLEIGQTAGYSDIPTWWVYFLVPYAFTFMAGQFLFAAWLGVRVPAADVHETEPEDMFEEDLPVTVHAEQGR